MSVISNRNWIYIFLVPTLLSSKISFQREEFIMSTMTIASPVQVTDGTSYMRNVGRAARALLVALIAIPHASTVAAPTKVETRKAARDDMSLYRLYCLASPYDSVMPNLAQELRVMANRDID